jgi:hypothetical protein
MSTEKGTKLKAMWLHSCIPRPLQLVLMGCRRSSRGSRLGEGTHGEGVDDGHVGNGDALCTWQGHEDATPSLMAIGGAVDKSACASSKSRMPAKGWLKCRGNARPVHSTTQTSFKMSWHSVNCAARAEHCMPWSVSEQGRVAPQPHFTVGALRGRMGRLSHCRRAVWNSPLSSSGALRVGGYPARLMRGGRRS